MWGALGKLVFKLFASLGAVFMIKRSGAKAQELKSAKKSLERTREANEIDENVARMSPAELNQELEKNQRD